MTQTVSGALERRQSKQASAVEQVKKDLRQNRGWFSTVVPRHIDPDQYVALCLGVISKGSDELKQALVETPHTFLQAASECARMGLVPGETFYFVPFRNKQGDSGSRLYEVVGIVSYIGEMDMIYRAGAVSSIHCHVVRANDEFRWQPGEMEIPHHVIHAPEGSKQVGLAGPEERGHLTGVYAYCVMTDGGYSQPTVMGASEVRAHRLAAKTDKFWGPVWALGEPPVEIRDTVAMWKKTAVHAQFDWVPHTSEYVREQMRVRAEAERHPVPVAAAPAKPELEAAPGVAASGPEDNGGEASEPQAPDEEGMRRNANARLHALFRTYGLGGQDQSDQRRAVISGLLEADHLIGFDELTAQNLATAATRLEAAAKEVTPDQANAHLAAYASRAAAEIMRKQQQS